MISNKNQTGLKFPWLQILPINHQFLNFSPQPRALYWVPTKVTRTDISTWMPYWSLELHKHSHHLLPSLPNQLPLRRYVSLRMFPRSRPVPELGFRKLSSPLPKHWWFRLQIASDTSHSSPRVASWASILKSSLMTFPPKVLILLSLCKFPISHMLCSLFIVFVCIIPF